ncbi:alpha/beta-hydrolase [Daedaleopsis nitida]|nr:alpha/beta-hydrolase [Daedaleopsis nitida]
MNQTATRPREMWSALLLLVTLIQGCLSTSLWSSSNPRPRDASALPAGPVSPDWQQYFQVKDPLPNVNWTLPRSFAGNLPVKRAEHPNNTLFFWSFEQENGSLTVAAGERADKPWGIWLNGGPGTSSMLGLGYENGPIRLSPTGSEIKSNNFSWSNLADFFWIDQPVGVGWSIAEEGGNVHDEDEVGRDFMGFLENLVEVFPSLKTRPLTLTGESYAGTYIPYIMKTYFGTDNPPAHIAAFAIGNGALGSTAVYNALPTVATLETYPQLIGYDTEVFKYFREQEHLCGYDLNLTYPQEGHFPSLRAPVPVSSVTGRSSRNLHTDRLMPAGVRLARLLRDFPLNEHQAAVFRRAPSFRSERPTTNGTLNPNYGCDLFNEMTTYALTNSAPWAVDRNVLFDYYDITDGLGSTIQLAGSNFFNDARARAALNAPTTKDWRPSIGYDFLGAGGLGSDPSPEPMVFLSELAANASERGVRVILYSGNNDALIAHRGTEVVIQNTTFGGIQGFTRRPSTPWYDDAGSFAGIVHQERNWTYVLVKDAGHLVPYASPSRAYVLFREFILGNNQTGIVTTSPNGTVTVVGGEDPALAADALTGQPGIYLGKGAEDSITTTGVYLYPSETVAAWESYLATATAANGT